MEMNKQSRGQFLKTLGLSSKALMAFYCIGAVSACSSEEETVSPGNTNTGNTGNTSSGLTGTTTGASIDYTIDLKNASYSKLTTAGEFVIIGDTLVANANGTYIAVSKSCTHQGTTLAFRKAEGDLWCSNHGSEFKTDGTVEKAPATTALKTYKTTFNAAASTLKIG
ncbi:QcrA and Rieske domain-containing protein [Lacihabitans soyangensis]|jgi:cytochrome b6-f complex iron-sulfur subunit|uniref:Rieske (2Fe-2S) protein n=1 Tax=Lacihabitans soyangensis TaxID=869394 RepID=A0AAE3KUU8_9BACT|nr:Rieske (2Fe-2S) protein [Lacihabitans soyangensis]MCP9765982.1 Rieske (2Fe-2S) protein [Lacihabitans soyangensis]